MTPRVTVVIPIHDQAFLLPACLRTVLAQEMREIEVLVVGDGCTDDSESAALAAGDRRLRWLGLPKAPGYGYANRARAIAEARGEWIAYLAPDDLWARDHLGGLLAALEAARCDMAFARPVIAGAAGTLSPHYLPFDVLASGPRPPIGARLAFVSPSQIVQRRELVERAGNWDGRRLEHGDIDLWRRCRRAGGRLLYVPRPSVVRFPSYAFRASGRDRLATLHASVAEQLVSGQLDLAGLRWPWPHRAFGWLRDAAVVSVARGPGFVRSLLKR